MRDIVQRAIAAARLGARVHTYRSHQPDGFGHWFTRVFLEEDELGSIDSRHAAVLDRHLKSLREALLRPLLMAAMAKAISEDADDFVISELQK